MSGQSTSDAAAPGSTAAVVEVLEAVRRSVQQVLDTTPGRLQRLRVDVADIVIELEWPQPTTGQPVPPAPEPEPTAAAVPAVPAVAGVAEGAVAADPGHVVRAPSVGTFYRAPEPGAEPFVAEGDLVRAGQQIAIVEAMKLMLPVEADQAGRVVRVLKSDSEPVEYDEPLFALETV